MIVMMWYVDYLKSSNSEFGSFRFSGGSIPFRLIHFSFLKIKDWDDSQIPVQPEHRAQSTVELLGKHCLQSCQSIFNRESEHGGVDPRVLYNYGQSVHLYGEVN